MSTNLIKSERDESLLEENKSEFVLIEGSQSLGRGRILGLNSFGVGRYLKESMLERFRIQNKGEL
jgi:hypothetical protein